MTYKYDYLVFIGRLQPPTRAHEQIIRTALTLSNRVIIVLGSRNSARTLRNPFTFDERETMTRAMFSSSDQDRLLFVAQDDHTYQDEKWLVTLQQKVKEKILLSIPGNRQNMTLHGLTDVRIGLIGHSKDATSYYLNLFPTWPHENVSAMKGVDATSVREAYFDQSPAQINPTHVHPEVIAAMAKFTATDAYRALVEERAFVRKYQQQWANSPYPPVFMTTDAIVIQSGHILLVKRGAMPGKGMWALPGGYLNPKETLEQGMLRELREETRLKVPEPVLRGSIQARETFDDPHRSPRGRTITTAFLIHLKGQRALPKVKGSDDAAHAQWVPIADLDPKLMFEDHFFIISVMLGRLKSSG
jgi:bifunctional NMN adenylyltransferase/nudix hydrolase